MNHSLGRFESRLSPAVRFLAAVAVVLSVSGVGAGRTPAVQAAPLVSLVVDSESDSGGLSTCSGADNDCSLRGAINKLIADSATNSQITFQSDVNLIVLLNPLPTITVTGTEIIGNSGEPRIDGLFMAAGDMLRISAPNVAVSGLSLVNGRPITDGLYADISVLSGTGVEIHHNYLGTLPPGKDVINCNPNPGGGSLVSRNSADGISVAALAGSSGAGNGSVYIYANTIGCHGRHGIRLFGTDYAYVGQDPAGAASGNFIGVNADGVGLRNGHGSAGVGGPGDGVSVVANGGNGARFNVIRSNTIAGNFRDGIRLIGTGTNNSNSTYGNTIAANRIGLDDLGAFGNQGDGIHLESGAYLNRIGGSSVQDRNVISANLGRGVYLYDSEATGILGNYIGTSLDGLSALGNLGHGVLIEASDSTLVGAYFALLVVVARENIISGNAGDGVQVLASSVPFISGNKIGTDATGLAALGNGGSGIEFNGVARGVITGNVVSDNVTGIRLISTQHATITANLIGTDAAGLADLGNTYDGIALITSAFFSRVGGNLVSDRNVISGNGFCGILVNVAHTNTINSNYIGLNSLGTEAIPNGHEGICLLGADGNQMGTGGVPQHIAGNGNHGLHFEDANFNVVGSANYIGVAADLSPLGNGGAGVRIESDSHDNGVYPQVNSHNVGAGVAILGADSVENDVAPFLNARNGGLPIDLGNNGHTPNDVGDVDTGPNLLLNYPVITDSSVHPVSGLTIITGTVCALCTVWLYEAIGDPSAPGGGGDYIVFVTADGSGQWNATLPSGQTEATVTLVARDVNFNTSEFSPRPLIVRLPLVIK
jgi:hypothetical protein